MPNQLPLVPSVPFYRVSTTLGGSQYVLDVRWNGRDSAWYLDIMDEEADPIAMGLKIVLGAPLGLRSVDPRFPDGALVVAAGTGGDAGLDDMGERVNVYFYPAATE